MRIPIDDIKKLREETKVSVIECKKALEEAGGDFNKARKLLRERGAMIAEKKKERETVQGIIDSYIHANGRIGVLIELSCETDFVAKNEEFKKLAHEIALQVASSNPINIEELLGQNYVRYPEKTIENLITETIAKVGENIKVMRFVRYEVGEYLSTQVDLST